MMLEKFDERLISFLTELESEGFHFTLVGGMVRDFFLNGSIGNDFDFEIRPNKQIAIENWEEYYSKVYRFLNNHQISFEKLPYLITKFKYHENTIEFSSPRLEYFEIDNKTHHNFNAELNPNLDHAESFKRRDFTINAIGISFKLDKKEEVLIDPFHGVEDLKLKTLKNINDDFYKDNIRFLRLIRFKNRFDFKIDENILNRISEFDLEHISDYHFYQELSKSKTNQYFSDLFILNDKLINKLPSKYNFLKTNVFPDIKIDKSDFINLLILNLNNSIEDIINLFPQNKNDIELKRKLIVLYSSLNKTQLFNDLVVFSQSNTLEFLKQIKNKEEFITRLNFLTNNSFQQLSKLLELINQTKLTDQEMNQVDVQKRSILLNMKIWNLWIQNIK